MANTMKMGDTFDWSIAGTDACADNLTINMNRTVNNVRTNCGNAVVAGANESTVDASGPLGFGASSTESLCYTSITATTAENGEFDPDGTGTATATNPIYTWTGLATSFSIAASVTAPITFNYSTMVTNTTGLPSRATA